jgi:hypothetical protein
LSVIKDKDLSYVERGEAVELLRQLGLSQQTIAKRTSLSKEAVSKSKICYQFLRGTARALCVSHRMQSDACCRLAHAASKDDALDEESVIRRAWNISQERDRKAKETNGLKGRRTPPGVITDTDMETALLDEKYRYHRG